MHSAFFTSGVSENQVEAFDLDAISGGSNISFGVDDSLSGVQGAAIGWYICRNQISVV